MKVFSKLKAVDFYKKLPQDLTEATLAGAWISIVAAVLMILLFCMEFYSFMSLQTKTELVVDRSSPDELLKINFNISYPSLSCEFATMDVSDALGTKRLNLTRTVRKTPINKELQRLGAATDDGAVKHDPKYDEEGTFADEPDVDVSQPLTRNNFDATLAHYPIVVVNFYAPWCHWCRRLEPTWEAATNEVHAKYPESDGRIRFAKVDCTKETDLCIDHIITGYPSIRVFRKGHDEVYVGKERVHEAYKGDRTRDALVAFADSLALSAGEPHRKHAHLEAAPRSSGCNMQGFVLVKKVPGMIRVAARSPTHSFDHSAINMTHVVHQFTLGTRPNVRMYKQLKRLHPAGLSQDWADKLYGKTFVSDTPQSTHEHYLQVVLTTVEPNAAHKGSSYDAYEYTVHSHTYTTDDIPAMRVTYDLSPIQILVSTVKKPWYHFLTTTCAIIGGVFTVAGIVDATLYNSINILKKVQLGKNT